MPESIITLFRPDKVRQMADFEKSQMQALCNQRRAAQLIERILTIRTRLMDPFSFAGRNESKKAGVRIHRNGQVRFCTKYFSS